MFSTVKSIFGQVFTRYFGSTEAMFRAAVKEEFLNMPLEEKRKHYRCGENFVTLSSIPTLSSEQEGITQPRDGSEEYPFREALNEKISIFTGDITTLEIDAIVNAANKSLLGGGGVDGAIHRAAGGALFDECFSLNGCMTGEAKITGGYKLPAKYVIHTVGPTGENANLLRSCYTQSLQVMKENQLKSIAFPCISTGAYGYPHKSAAQIALRTVREFLENEENLQTVDRIIFCLFLEVDKNVYQRLIPRYFPIQ